MFLTSSRFRLTPSDTKVVKTDVQHASAWVQGGDTPTLPSGTHLAEGRVRGGAGILEATTRLNFQGQVDGLKVR